MHLGGRREEFPLLFMKDIAVEVDEAGLIRQGSFHEDCRIRGGERDFMILFIKARIIYKASGHQ